MYQNMGPHLGSRHIYIYIPGSSKCVKFVPFSPTKRYKKAEILHIWKIQVYYIYIYYTSVLYVIYIYIYISKESFEPPLSLIELCEQPLFLQPE